MDQLNSYVNNFTIHINPFTWNYKTSESSPPLQNGLKTSVDLLLVQKRVVGCTAKNLGMEELFTVFTALINCPVCLMRWLRCKLQEITALWGLSNHLGLIHGEDFTGEFPLLGGYGGGEDLEGLRMGKEHEQNILQLKIVLNNKS